MLFRGTKRQGSPLHHRLLHWRRKTAEQFRQFQYSKTGYYEKLKHFLPVEKPGFFLEAGAHDGFTGSNTYSLEVIHGWRGVLVEPITQLFEQCKRNRPGSEVLHGALVSKNHNDFLVEIADMGLVSSVATSKHFGTSELIHASQSATPAGKIKVPALTLDVCLRSASINRPTFISLDVEGFEAEALKGLSLQDRGPDWFLIELNYPEDVLKLLEPHYEKVAEITGIDWLFRRKVNA